MSAEVPADFVDLVQCLREEQCALLQNKRAAGRAEDLADAEVLEELRARRRR